jgi:flagellar biosynthesis/type III secretory pathway protein FliH
MKEGREEGRKEGRNEGREEGERNEVVEQQIRRHTLL